MVEFMEEKKINKYNKHMIRRFKRNNAIFVGLSVFLGIVLVVFIYNFLLLPSISLNGSRYIEIGYKDEYVEKGYKASFLGRDVTKNVRVTGSVNSNKLGTYDVSYTVKEGLFKKKIVRKVRVIDKNAPVIKLVSDEDILVCPGKKYKEEEYSAVDDYDGDITDKVKVSKSKNKITYTVKDKYGNKSSISRKIIYKDEMAPVVKLNGNEIVYVSVGDNYKELGVSVSDNCDSDLDKAVKISGSVDTSKVGEYKITYTVSDKKGNKASVERKVIVSKRGANGTIYLTFDDGPKYGTTNVILDILKEEGVKATFFVTGYGPDELIKRAYEEGHTIALHTYSHTYSSVYASVDAYFNDLGAVSERVKRITGEESKIIRFPGGASNTISRRYSPGIMSTLTKEVLNKGYRYYDWNVSSGDATNDPNVNSNVIYNNVVSRLSRDRINIVLMHDVKAYTRDALRNIIKFGKDNGYTFDKITMGTEMVTQRVNN